MHHSITVATDIRLDNLLLSGGAAFALTALGLLILVLAYKLLTGEIQ